MERYLYQWMLLLVVINGLAYGQNSTVNTQICNDITAADGSNYNLQTLTEKGKMQFQLSKTVVTGMHVLSISLCSNDDCFGTPSAACMCSKAGAKCLSTYPFGEFTPASINALDDGAGVEFNYKNTHYWTKLILLCDYNFVGVENYNWTLKRDGDGFLDGVTITVRTEAACAIEVPTSGGTIFMLIVLCLAVLYLVCGVLYNKFSLMKQGREVLPHSDFWGDLPSLVKEGAVYTFSVRRSQSSSSYENVTA